jgi:hypothetical protein
MAAKRDWKRAVNPISRLSSMVPSQDGVERARDVVSEARADAPDSGGEWFGWVLPEGGNRRYAAVGFGERGFVVDVISGHILWEGAIAGRRELPRSMAELGRRPA